MELRCLNDMKWTYYNHFQTYLYDSHIILGYHLFLSVLILLLNRLT